MSVKKQCTGISGPQLSLLSRYSEHSTSLVQFTGTVSFEFPMQPDFALQRKFWDTWNTSWRIRASPTQYMAAQLSMANRFIGKGSVLEIGCGTGWLSNALNQGGRNVTGVDLSEAAIAHAQAAYPACVFRAGDFFSMSFNELFDHIVTADCLGHVEDHEAFIARTASLLRMGGTFLLMTQNPFAWNHSSELTRQGEGQIRNWPSLSIIRQLLKRNFCISEVHGIMPMGDKGIMRIIQAQPTRILVRLLVGKSVRDKLYDRYTGRELIVVARRCQ